MLLNYDAADLTLEGAFLAGLIAGPYTGAIVGAAIALPGFLAGEWGAIPFAVGCGFAGGGLREACPKEHIWNFSPFVFFSLPRYAWRMIREFADRLAGRPAARPDRPRSHPPGRRRRASANTGSFYFEAPSPWLTVMVYVATVLTVSIPIKIWNNARIEHRLQEQEKLLLRGEDRSAQEPDQSALPVQHPDVRLVADPLAARDGAHGHPQAVGPAAKTAAQSGAVRDAARGARLDRRVSRHRSDSLRPAARVSARKSPPDTLDIIVPSMILQPLVENAIKHGLTRKVGPGHITLRSRRERATCLILDVEDDGLGISDERLQTAMSSGIGLSNVHERLRVIYGATGRRRCCADRRARVPARTSRFPILVAAAAGQRLMATTAALTAVVADDEQLARDELCFLLGKIDGVEIVSQAADGVQALDDISRLTPDVAFLDVQMPGLTGFEVARRLLENGTDLAVVFVTAFDHRAVEAFEVNAVDYVLKPVEPTRLEQAVQRVRRRRTEQPLGDQLERLVRMMAGQKDRRNQVAVKMAERIVLVQADDIIYASLAEDSISIVTGQVSGTSNYRTLDELQARLDPEVFWRVHRSHLVNINKIKEIVPWFSRNYILRMKDAKATEIPVSRSQTRRLREYLKL